MPARIYVALHFGAGDRSRTYTGVSPEDFESSASAIPPLRHVNILGQDSLVSNFISTSREIGVLKARRLATHNLRRWDGQHRTCGEKL